MTREQLEATGVRGSAISRRVAAGRLHRIHRSVYAVGHERLSFEGRCLAAVLACGGRAILGGRDCPDRAVLKDHPIASSDQGRLAVLSHRSAAGLWGMLPAVTGEIEVTVAGQAGRRRRRGITIHRSVSLSPRETTRRVGVPVTRPVRTLRDLRRVAAPKVHQRAVRRALDLRLVREDELGPEPDLTRSELERTFVRLCRRHRLPAPEVNVRVGPIEVDFLWRELRLVVETDGFRHHGDRAAFERDRSRDVDLQTRGYRVLRFTYRQVRDEPRAVSRALRAVLPRQR